MSTGNELQGLLQNAQVAQQARDAGALMRSNQALAAYIQRYPATADIAGPVIDANNAVLQGTGSYNPGMFAGLVGIVDQTSLGREVLSQATKVGTQLDRALTGSGKAGPGKMGASPFERFTAWLGGVGGFGVVAAVGVGLLVLYSYRKR